MYQLHPYQANLVKQARSKFAEGIKSILIVSPAGSGKSVVIAEIARLAVEKGGQVMFMVHRQELVNQITESFEENSVDLNHTTIMTVGKIVNRLETLPKPTLIITDETHHSKAKTYRRIYDYYSDVPKLGFSATPWRLSGAGLDDIYDEMIEGPDVRWLIDNRYLAPFKYYSVKLVDDSVLKKASTGDYSNKSIDEAIGKTVFGDVVATYMKKTPNEQAIVYAHDVEYSKAIAAEFRANNISSVHADAKTPKKERDQIMSDFKSGKIKVLSNVDLISEGFNVPDCTVVIMLRPTQSLVLDVQQGMRSMRYKPDKQATIIDHVANYTRFGLPDTPREWSLEGRPKKKSKKPDGPMLKTCLNCYAVITVQCTVCPQCGAEIEIKSKGLDHEQAELEEVQTFSLVTDYADVEYAQMKPEDAKSVEELYKIAKARGYKPGWAYMQGMRLGMLKKRSG